MTRKVSVFLLAMAVLVMVVSVQGQPEAEALLSQADQAFRTAVQRVSQSKLELAIKTYHKALDTEAINFEQRKKALNRLSKAFYLLANHFLTENRQEQKKAYTKGRRYGMLSLIMNFKFRTAYGDDPEQELAEEDLKHIKDIDAFYWAVSNAIRLDEFKGIIKQQARIPFYKAVYRKLIDMDETYAGGGPHRSLGTLHCKVHFKPVVGGFLAKSYGLSGEQGKQHLLKAMEIAPGYLENKLFYAKYWARVKDKELALQLLKEVINAPQEVVDKYPLRNWSAQRKAKSLLEELT